MVFNLRPVSNDRHIRTGRYEVASGSHVKSATAGAPIPLAVEVVGNIIDSIHIGAPWCLNLFVRHFSGCCPDPGYLGQMPGNSPPRRFAFFVNQVGLDQSNLGLVGVAGVVLAIPAQPRYVGTLAFFGSFSQL